MTEFPCLVCTRFEKRERRESKTASNNFIELYKALLTICSSSMAFSNDTVVGVLSYLRLVNDERKEDLLFRFKNAN